MMDSAATPAELPISVLMITRTDDKEAAVF